MKPLVASRTKPANGERPRIIIVMGIQADVFPAFFTTGGFNQITTQTSDSDGGVGPLKGVPIFPIHARLSKKIPAGV